MAVKSIGSTVRNVEPLQKALKAGKIKNKNHISWSTYQYSHDKLTTRFHPITTFILSKRSISQCQTFLGILCLFFLNQNIAIRIGKDLEDFLNFLTSPNRVARFFFCKKWEAEEKIFYYLSCFSMMLAFLSAPLMWR